MKREDAQFTAHLRLSEGVGFPFAEGTQLTGAALNNKSGNVVRERGRLGAGTFRIRKNVEIGERECLDEGERGGVVAFRFTREAGDNVSANGSVGKALVDKLD